MSCVRAVKPSPGKKVQSGPFHGVSKLFDGLTKEVRVKVLFRHLSKSGLVVDMCIFFALSEFSRDVLPEGLIGLAEDHTS